MTGQQAVLKFVAATGNQSYCWLLLSWIFTNQIQTAFCKLQILVVTDPRGPSDLTCPTLLWTEQTLCPVDVAVQHVGKGIHSMALL